VRRGIGLVYTVRMVLLPLILAAFWIQVPEPVVVTFPAPLSQTSNLATGGGPACGLNPGAPAALNYPRGVPFLAWVWMTSIGGCEILAVPQQVQRPQRMIPVYTAAGLFTMTQVAASTANGDDVWCMASPPTVDYAVRLIQPAAVVEQRSQVQAFAVSGLDAFGQPLSAPTATQLVPLPQPPLWTVVGPTPQPGTNPWESYVSTYPAWSASDSANCGGNPSIAFASNSLGTGESRDSVKMLVVY
jgi:hypothetical protein